MKSKEEIKEAFELVNFLHEKEPNQAGWWMATAALAWVLQVESLFVYEQFKALIVGWRDLATAGGYIHPTPAVKKWCPECGHPDSGFSKCFKHRVTA